MRKRTFFQSRPGKSSLPPVATHWGDLARTARNYLDEVVPESYVRQMMRRASSYAPLGAAGDANPCTRLCEELDRRMNPPPGVWRPGVDRDAMTADNRDEILRLAALVEERVAAHQAVAAAERSVR
jgi:hypothetical protein